MWPPTTHPTHSENPEALTEERLQKVQKRPLVLSLQSLSEQKRKNELSERAINDLEDEKSVFSICEGHTLLFSVSVVRCYLCSIWHIYTIRRRQFAQYKMQVKAVAAKIL
jgi:hypothetical protein